MIRSLTIALARLALVGMATLAMPVAASAEPATYNDDGMHFEAPADFEKVNVPPADPTGSDDDDTQTPVALFLYHKGKLDQRSIQISVARFDGTVDKFDQTQVAEERKGETSFIAKNEKTTLQNGMPAYFVKLNSGATAGAYVQAYQYLVCDGTRSIIVAYVGPQDSFGDAAAKAALASLSIVVYPKHRA